MSSIKDLKLAQKAANEQRQVILELKTLVKDIERCEKTIVELKQELENVNSRHQGRRTTREDIAYLTDLLECAKKSWRGKRTSPACKSERRSFWTEC
jgi:hypothetical protein